MTMYRSETFLTHFGLVERLNEGIKPDQIVSITNASKESRGWVLIYKEDNEDCKKEESILDKIRADIEGMYRVVLKDTPKDDWAVRWNDCLDEVLKIIDKYKAESEGKND